MRNNSVLVLFCGSSGSGFVVFGLNHHVGGESEEKVVVVFSSQPRVSVISGSLPPMMKPH